MNDAYNLRSALIDGFNGRPALVAPCEVEKITSLFGGVIMRTTAPSADERSRAEEAGVATVEQAYSESFSRAPDRKPFLFSNGLAFIPMRGVLVHRNGDPWAGTRGYDDIRREFDAAMSDPDVSGIVFDSHTGGGMVYGNFELCAHIASKRGAKPMMTVVNAGALSGGYSLASATDKIVSTQSGDVGSIGVLTMHFDVSKALEKFGVDVSIIHAGAHKVDGNPFQPLSAEVREDMQKRIDVMYQKFVSTVASNRNMTEKAVRDTEARVFQADDALAAGLIDAIMSPQAAVAAFRAEVFGSTNHDERSEAMSNANQQGNTEGAAPDTQANADKTNAAVAADRSRTKAILTSPEAAGREDLANHLAYDTEMSADAAIAMLAKAPKPAAAAATGAPTALAAAMAATGGGANVASEQDSREGGDQANQEPEGGVLLSALASATGNKKLVRTAK